MNKNIKHEVFVNSSCTLESVGYYGVMASSASATTSSTRHINTGYTLRRRKFRYHSSCTSATQRQHPVTAYSSFQLRISRQKLPRSLHPKLIHNFTPRHWCRTQINIRVFRKSRNTACRARNRDGDDEKTATSVEDVLHEVRSNMNQDWGRRRLEDWPAATQTTATCTLTRTYNIENK